MRLRYRRGNETCTVIHIGSRIDCMDCYCCLDKFPVWQRNQPVDTGYMEHTDWFQIGKEICHLGMVVTMTADPKCGTQQVIQLFHTMSWLLFLESTSSTTSSTSYEFNGVIQGYGLVLNTMGNTWEPLVIPFFEITVYYRNCSSEMNSAIHGP